MRKKVLTTVYLEQDQMERLRRVHEQTKVPMAELVREGVYLMLALREETPAIAGAGATSGAPS